ncbi:MAG: GspMb/PilO family protein [Steroidobacteraceae bacterium]
MTASEYLSSQPLITRRLFALLLLIAVGTGVWEGFILPAGRLFLSQDVWRTTVVRDLGYNRGIVATEPQAREQLQVLRAASTWQRLFQDSPLGANEQLKAEVAQALNAAAAVTLHLTSLPAQDEGGLRKYGLRAVATLDAGQLKLFLDALRARSHYLRVEQLAVTAPPMQSPDSNPTLQLKADIFGYASTPGRRAAK